MVMECKSKKERPDDGAQSDLGACGNEWAAGRPACVVLGGLQYSSASGHCPPSNPATLLPPCQSRPFPGVLQTRKMPSNPTPEREDLAGCGHLCFGALHCVVMVTRSPAQSQLLILKQCHCHQLALIRTWSTNFLEPTAETCNHSPYALTTWQHWQDRHLGRTVILPSSAPTPSVLLLLSLLSDPALRFRGLQLRPHMKPPSPASLVV